MKYRARMRTISDWLIDLLIIITGIWPIWLYVNVYWFPEILAYIFSLSHIAIVTIFLYKFIPDLGIAYLVISLIIFMAIITFGSDDYD